MESNTPIHRKSQSKNSRSTKFRDRRIRPVDGGEKLVLQRQPCKIYGI